MAYLAICRILSKYVFSFALILLIPLAVSLFYEISERTFLKETSASFSFIKTILVCLGLGGITFVLGRKAEEGSLHRRDSIFLVASIWLLTAALAALPFIFSQTISNPLDAYFESMSGLTTTGASIVHPKAYDPISGQEIPITMNHPNNPSIHYTFYGTVAPIRDAATGEIIKEGVEALGKPILFWRSFIQWLGGIGIVVLFIAILPSLSIRGKVLYEAEVTGPIKEGLTPRIKDTAILLSKIYCGLTLAQILCLLISDRGMSLFDAATITFTTLSTGGFTTHNQVMGEYLNIKSLAVVTFFMILGGVNFSLYFYCIKRKFFRLYQPELYYYVWVLIGGSLFVAYGIWNNASDFIGGSSETYSFQTALGYGIFQAVSAQTSTGFTVINYDSWPYISQFIMVILMYIGAMSGSTAGGIKIIRSVIAFRVITYKIETFFHRDIYRILRVGDKEITEKTASTVLAFLCIATFLVALGCFFLIWDDLDPMTALAVISTSINNTGLIFSGIGSTASLAFLSDFSKVISILWMLLGRLEFLSILVLLLPSFWKNR